MLGSGSGSKEWPCRMACGEGLSIRVKLQGLGRTGRTEQKLGQCVSRMEEGSVDLLPTCFFNAVLGVPLCWH